jgi:hypothetical protein
MADTLQLLQWALARRCQLRTGADWQSPTAAWRQLGGIRTVCSAAAAGRIIDDICVTSITYSGCRDVGPVELPCDGQPVATLIGAADDLAQVRAMCGVCEANVAAPAGAEQLVGCWGSVTLSPQRDGLDRALRRAVRQTAQQAAVRELFPQTSPMWFGLWIESPLTPAQCSVLRTLLTAPSVRDYIRSLRPGVDVGATSDLQRDVDTFVAALRLSCEQGLPIHVLLPPPGHTDFGIYTTFPHCQRCKAESHLSRWRRQYPDRQVRCRVCGERYNPHETHARAEMADRDDEMWQADADFQRRYLTARGHDDDQVAAVLRWEAEKQQAWAQGNATPGADGRKTLSVLLGLLAMAAVFAAVVAYYVYRIVDTVTNW